MKRRIAAVLAALALALTACSASGEAGSKGSGKAVTVGLTYVPDIQFAPSTWPRRRVISPGRA